MPQEPTVSFTWREKKDEHLDKQIISAQDCSGSTELFHYHATAIWVTLNYSVIRLPALGNEGLTRGRLRETLNKEDTKIDLKSRAYTVSLGFSK